MIRSRLLDSLRRSSLKRPPSISDISRIKLSWRDRMHSMNSWTSKHLLKSLRLLPLSHKLSLLMASIILQPMILKLLSTIFKINLSQRAYPVGILMSFSVKNSSPLIWVKSARAKKCTFYKNKQQRSKTLVDWPRVLWMTPQIHLLIAASSTLRILLNATRPFHLVFARNLALGKTRSQEILPTSLILLPHLALVCCLVTASVKAISCCSPIWSRMMILI